MTVDQIHDAIDLYNRHADALAVALDKMDSQNRKISAKGSDAATAALAAMGAISELLELLGYELITDDGEGGHAIDICAADG